MAKPVLHPEWAVVTSDGGAIWVLTKQNVDALLLEDIYARLDERGIDSSTLKRTLQPGERTLSAAPSTGCLIPSRVPFLGVTAGALVSMTQTGQGLQAPQCYPCWAVQRDLYLSRDRIPPDALVDVKIILVFGAVPMTFSVA